MIVTGNAALPPAVREPRFGLPARGETTGGEVQVAPAVCVRARDAIWALAAPTGAELVTVSVQIRLVGRPVAAVRAIVSDGMPAKLAVTDLGLFITTDPGMVVPLRSPE